MPLDTSIINRLTPGSRVTGVLLIIGIITAGMAWHIRHVNASATAHLRQETVLARRTTLRRRLTWRALATQVRAYGPGPGQSINTTVPLALGAFERAAVTCDTPMSSLTSTAQGTVYAMNPGRVAQPIPWAPGVKTVVFVAEGQWHTLAGLDCLARSLRHQPVALAALDINATAYTAVLGVLGE